MPIETLNQWGETWASFIWYRMIDSTLVLAIVGILWLVLRRHAAAQFGYLLFLLVLLRLAVPGHISIPNLIVNLLPQETADQGAPSTGFGGWWLFGGV